ncbi:ketopantoate reductase family protein [Pendulispora albinea]|uniref:2-dehydropantoate 2-reductase n=1 Tax=Pendulispora albinea TaxID=2741071 RepID=A0ABZ2LX55_9BACT
MHVAIVGAGSLGSVFGVRLANGAEKVRVSFVMRSAPAPGREPLGMRIEQVDRGSGVLALEAPVRTTAIPADADVILVCVRFEQVDGALAALLAPSRAPVVTMTPIFPQHHALLVRELGAERLFPGMPGVVAYSPGPGETSNGEGAPCVRYRYWLPRAATTLIEQPERRVPAIDALAQAFEGAGISSRAQAGVHATNVATTCTFVPVMMGIDVTGSIDALLGDDTALDLVLRAAEEARILARHYGKPAIWADWFVRFLSRSRLGAWAPKAMVAQSLRLGVGFARRRSPEGVAYVEEHFGRKLRAQNLQMAEKMVELFRERSLPHEAMAELRDRLRGPGSVA